MPIDNMPPLLVSACLLGIPCKWNGQSNAYAPLLGLKETHQLIPVCPEQLGGLPTPREAAEIVDERVLTQSGADVTAAFFRGAEAVLQIAQVQGCRQAILKARSPSCGCRMIYDGSFSGKLIPGQGLTARLLRENGIQVVSEEDPLPGIYPSSSGA